MVGDVLPARLPVHSVRPPPAARRGTCARAPSCSSVLAASAGEWTAAQERDGTPWLWTPPAHHPPPSRSHQCHGRSWQWILLLYRRDNLVQVSKSRYAQFARRFSWNWNQFMARRQYGRGKVQIEYCSHMYVWSICVIYHCNCFINTFGTALVTSTSRNVEVEVLVFK